MGATFPSEEEICISRSATAADEETAVVVVLTLRAQCTLNIEHMKDYPSSSVD